VSIFREIEVGAVSFSSTFVVGGMSSLPGCCRLLGVPADTDTFVFSLLDSFCNASSVVFADFSTLSAFLFPALGFAVAFTGVSGMAFFSFGSDFFVAVSTVFANVSLAACGFVLAALLGDFVGVAGTVLVPVGAVMSVGTTTFAGCLFFLVFVGVSTLTGVTGTTGTTGTAGMMVDEVVRDIGRELGREPGRELASSAIALGMAGAVKPGGMVGVERRGCSKN
jgi:hypothetical protein